MSKNKKPRSPCAHSRPTEEETGGVGGVSQELGRQDLQVSQTQTRVLTLPFPPTFTFLRNQALLKHSGRLPRALDTAVVLFFLASETLVCLL